MSLQEWRCDLEKAKASLTEGNLAASLVVIERVLAAMDERTLVTTTEAAELLGVRSPNTIKGWTRTGYLRGVRRGGRTLIPLTEVERIQGSDQVRRIQMDDALHEASEAFSLEG